MSLPLALALVLTAAPKAHVTLGKVTASEALPAVTAELKTHLEPLEMCFELAKNAAPKLAGALTVTFTAEPEGGVTAISASADSLKDDTLQQCVMARLRAGQWAAKEQPLTVTVTFHFK